MQSTYFTVELSYKNQGNKNALKLKSLSISKPKIILNYIFSCRKKMSSSESVERQKKQKKAGMKYR